MKANQDFKDMFKILNEEQVEYVIVGAHAVIYYTEPRYTKDLDILVFPSLSNAKKLWKALKRFGAPLKDISVEDFTDEDIIYQIGVEPNRIDILVGIDGLTADEAFMDITESTYDEVPIRILNKGRLIKAKRASNRIKDQLDLENLEK